MQKDTKLKSLTFELLDDLDLKLSESTKKSYYQRLNWIKKELNLDTSLPEKIVEDVGPITKLLESSKIALSSKALTAVHLSQLAKILDLDDDIKEQYADLVKNYTSMSDMTRRTNKLEGKKADRFVPWPEIKEVYDKMPEDDFTTVQDKVIVGLYTRMKGVLRLDYANVKVYNNKDDERKTNWFYKGKNDYAFYLHQYKTSSSHGSKIFEVTDEDFKRLLGVWFKSYNKTDWLLVSYKDHDKPLNETSLSRRIEYIFQKYLGKKINNGMLRVSVESNIINDPNYKNLSLNEQIALHENQLHSFQRAHEYAKKDI